MYEPTLQKDGGRMKKSEMYRLAQIAVVNSQSICVTDKLEVLKELMDAEKLSRFGEEQEEKK